MPPDEHDARLRARLIAGDDGALAEVYDRWSALVHTIAARVTGDHAAADDLTHDVFVRLWERPRAYDPTRGSLRTWLCMVTRGRALDWLRHRAVRARYQASAVPEADPGGVDEAVIWRTETKVVREAVLSLPEPQRAAVLLAYYQGHTYRQVAHELNIPEGTAKARLRLALATIADRLYAEGIAER